MVHSSLRSPTCNFMCKAITHIE